MIKLEHTDGLTTFNLHCDICGELLRELDKAAVPFQDDGQYWFVHKGACFRSLEKDHGGRMPWWELMWFIRCILQQFKDYRLPGDTTDAYAGFTLKRRADY